jgi:biotin-(acetyl-CoA carboxylase) ligase
LIGGRKAAGILCESSGGFLYAGIGVNCADRAFPPGLRRPATSLEAVLGRPVDPMELFPVLARELGRSLFEEAWREEVEERLQSLGERVVFLEGDPGTGRLLEGRLAGLGPGGELLLDLPGQGLTPCSSGELRLASAAAPR